MFHQMRIVNRADSVPDAFGSDLERLPYALGIGRLAGVTGQTKPAVTRLPEQIRKPDRRTFFLEPAEANRDDTVIHALGRKIEHGLGGFGSELADRIQDPAHGEFR